MLLRAEAVHPYASLMSKSERLREEIGWLKVLCGLCAAGLMSLIAWLVQNYETAARGTTVLAFCSAIALIEIIVAVVVRMYRCFNILEEL
jgi:hypothetical protein